MNNLGEGQGFEGMIQQSDISKTLAERGARYGSFTDNSTVSQSLKQCLWSAPRFTQLAPDQKECLEMIAQKIARILNGDPDYTDNWHDIIGYAKLVEDRLNGTNK